MNVWTVARMLAVFITCYAGFNLGYFWLPDAWLQEVAHRYGILIPSAEILNRYYGNDVVRIEGGGLASQDAYLAVVRGCDGAGLAFLLISAIACYPINWKSKLKGVLVGACLVYVLNLARIVGLFIVFQENRVIFASLHNFAIPLVLLLLCGTFFLWWTSSTALDN